MSHRDSVSRAPEGAVVTASTPGAPIAAFEHRDRGMFAVQFHPEFKSKPLEPHPLFQAFIGAAYENGKSALTTEARRHGEIAKAF